MLNRMCSAFPILFVLLFLMNFCHFFTMATPFLLVTDTACAVDRLLDSYALGPIRAVVLTLTLVLNGQNRMTLESKKVKHRST